MDTQSLYALAEQQNIEVVPFSLPQNGSMSIQLENGTCCIGVDKSVQSNSILERTHIAHELGHCITGSFYSIYTARDCRQRHENRADKWAIQELVPVDALDEAILRGYTEIWELAEHFGVTEKFMRKAVCYHVHGNTAAELYF